MDLAGIINPVQQSLHFQKEDLRAQYVAMKIALRAGARCIAARSRGLYKEEEFIPCDSDLDQNTTTAGKLVTLQWVKETLDKLDKDMDQRRPAQDPPSPAPEGLDRRKPAQDQPQRDPPHPAREEISSPGGMLLHVHSRSKKKQPRSYAGRELRSLVADCINKYPKAGADSKTMFDDIFVLVQGKWQYLRTRVLTIDTFQQP